MVKVIIVYNSQSIATKIKTLAKSKKIPIGKMLSECDLSVNTLSSMQSGGYFPRLEAFSKIADYLNCSIDYLLGRTEQPSSTVNSIEGNVTGSAVMQGSHSSNVTVTNGASALTEEETELLRLFQSLDVKKRVKILNFCYSLEDETPVG